VLYIGDGSSRAVTGVGFQPDLVWLKQRNGTAYHALFDSVRGPGRQLHPNETNAEGSGTQLTGFDSDGFSLNSSSNTYNGNGSQYVAWCWKAGGPTVTNTDGTITSQVSANQTAGFSIISYTGTGSAETLGHGLDEKIPSFIIQKDRDPNATSNWIVYHKSLGATKYVLLNTTGAEQDNPGAWNDTEPTSSLINIGNFGDMSPNGIPCIMYAWAEIEGFSKFGSFEANGNADGPFVYLGFKPAFLICKNIDATESWLLKDSSRQPTNPNEGFLLANTNGVENFSVGNDVDFLSNGFKIRTTNNPNTSGSTYIFAAFAESPFTTANAK